MGNARDIYFSFFMFEANAGVHDANLRLGMERHMRELAAMGYAGFELHIARDSVASTAFPSVESEIEAYREFRQQLDDAGLAHVQLTTNVGATPECDPGSPDAAIRAAGLAYLKSRVDVTAALRGKVMMGPVVIPYGMPFEGVWSDALQAELARRYRNAAPVLDELGRHAQSRGVNIAIEPISHWETPGPNTLAQVMDFLQLVPARSVGVVIDSAHETLDGAGPEIFASQVKQLADAGRLHYVQASSPDRGDLSRSWVPWQALFAPLLANYSGPVAIEIFNAIPVFAAGLRLSRRKYWIPGLDASGPQPSAYEVALASLAKLQEQFARLDPQLSKA